MAYDELDTDTQIAELTELARRAGARFGVVADSLSLVLHECNTTFRGSLVDGGKVALRVNTNSPSTVAHVSAQQAWVREMATRAGVLMAEPLTTPEGAWSVTETDQFGTSRIVTCARWLTGSAREEMTADTARELGRIAARLHRASDGWMAPQRTSLPELSDPLFGDPDVVSDLDLSFAQRAVLQEARTRADRAFAESRMRLDRLAIHADLHAGNLLVDASRSPAVAVIDVDDMGWGTTALDLAIAVFYLRGSDGVPLEVAFRAGYAEVAPWPGISEHSFEALIASRQLLLANALYRSSTAEHRAIAEDYLMRTITRLRAWLDTGRFLLDPA